MVVSTLLISMFIVYGCLAIYGIEKSIVRAGASASRKSDDDPWYLIKIPLRNKEFENSGLYVIAADFDMKKCMFYARITGDFRHTFDVYAKSIKELEDKIDAEYIRIMNSYKEIAGNDYIRTKNDGTVLGWKDGHFYVRAVLK